MAGSKKQKFAHELTPEAAAHYLRQLADALDQGRVKINQTDQELEGVIGVKGSVRNKAGRTALRLKLKFTGISELTADEAVMVEEADAAIESETASPDEPETSYKKLKKRMSRRLRALSKQAEEGVMPGLEDVEAFYTDCRAMTGFPGLGDEYYDRFNEGARVMLEEAKSGRPEGLGQALEALKAMRKECHSLYK